METQVFFKNSFFFPRKRTVSIWIWASRCPWCTKEISFTGLGFGTFLIYILQALYPCSDEFSSNNFLMTVWHSLTHVCFWNSFHLSEHQATSLLGVSTEAWPGHWTTSSFWYCTARRGVVVVVFKPLGKSWDKWSLFSCGKMQGNWSQTFFLRFVFLKILLLKDV